MWSVRAESVDSDDAVALLRDYFVELTVRYFYRETTDEEIDETLDEYRSTGLALHQGARGGVGLQANVEMASASSTSPAPSATAVATQRATPI